MKYTFTCKIKWKHILILFITFLCMMTFMRYTASQVKTISGGTGILDLNLGNSIGYILQTMNRLGNDGREYYLTHFLVVDFFYAMVYAMFYFFSILFLLYKNNVKRKGIFHVCFLPIAGMFFDWLENLFLSLLILTWPTKSVILCIAFIISNIFKFLLVYSSLLLVILGLLYYFIRKITKQI